MATQVGTVKPVALEWLGIGPERNTPGVIVAPSASIPADRLEPDEKPIRLDDKALRGVMGSLFAVIDGTNSSDFNFGGPVYMDIMGHVLLNLFGDYSATGSTPTSATTFTGALAVGATTGTLTSAVGYTASSIVQIGSGATAEVVQLTGLAGSVATWANNPCRFAHAGTPAAAIVSAPFSHTFSLLNSGSGQPQTHTLTHYNGLTGTFLAAQYGYWTAQETTFTLDPEKLFTHETKGCAYIQAAATAAPVNTISTVPAFAGWKFGVGIGGPASGGTQIFDVVHADLTVAREVRPRWTASGQQAAYVFGRNALKVTGKFTEIAQAATPMTNFLNNTQQQLQFAVTNGLSGANLLALTFNMQLAALKTAKLMNASGEIEYETTFEAIDNSTNAGGSGALSPASILIQNAIPTY